MLLGKSLAKEFFVFISVIIVMALGVNTYLLYENESANINNSLHSHALSLAELLASISIDPLLVYDDVTLDSYAEFTSKQKNIVFACVVNKEKISLTHYLNHDNAYLKKIPGASTAIDIMPVLTQLKENENILFIEVPVIFEGNTIAYTWVGLDKLPYNEKSVRTLLQIIGLTFGVGLFVGVSIFILFRWKIFQPIELLTRSTQSITNLEFENPVVIKGKGELSVLAEAFDRMRFHLKESLESRNKAMSELSDLNESLEERVAERTQELQLLNAKMTHQAMHDDLTGLPNRVLIVEQLKVEIKHAIRDNTGLAVFLIDLNNFKDVNDTLGHPVGDSLLKDVAQRLRDSLRDSDTVGRLGGDEFAVVLPRVTLDDATQVAEKIRDNLGPGFNFEEHALKVDASIGVAMYPEHGDDHTSLIRTADVAMYEAKRSEFHICVYDPELDTHIKTRLSLINDLEKAISQDELELYYQPKVAIKESKVLSVEALLRWQHPVNGWIAPDEFIALAERSNLINSLSHWVLRKAFSQWKEWQQTGISIQVAINLSAKNLSDDALPDTIENLVNEFDVIDGAIKLEITESAIMSNIDIVMEIFDDHRMHKMEFSIDDFGTGYSSLNYLKKLSVNEVKIDKAFVFDMAHDEDDKVIVKSVIDLAHNLGHNVVAEGVENKETLELLTQMGCDVVQGYYFAKPVPASEIRVTIKQIESQLK